jgi:hypothetical protein
MSLASRPLQKFLLAAAGILVLTGTARTQDPSKKKALRALEPQPVLESPLTDHHRSEDPTKQRDFPVMAVDTKGTAWIALIEHNGTSDTLKLVRRQAGAFTDEQELSKPGIVHQPSLACEPGGRVWCFWGQVNSRDTVSLRARSTFNGILDPEITLAESEGSDTFSDAATDPAGRTWVVWQSMRRGQADVFARWHDPKNHSWSPEIQVSRGDGGYWEPRIAFGADGSAWVVFDSSRGGEFNLFISRVTPDGAVEEHALTNSPRYEARARVAASPDGKSLWIAAESGREKWGRPLRGHQSSDGLNGQKRLLFGRFDVVSKTFSEIELPAQGRPAPRGALAVNLPNVACDSSGRVWMAWRFFSQTHWRLAVSRYDPQADSWTEPMEIPDSAFGQDRHCSLAVSNGEMLICWASDKREFKAPQVSGIGVGTLAPHQAPLTPRRLRIVATAENEKPLLNEETPPRPRNQHHSWSVGGKTYRLVWGDLHRHTDFSNCRTGHDGCVLEHFRYAYDIAALDFMGTSDHTDIAKRYDPYEWWQTQRLVDVFYVPGRFNSLYAYEREQPFPWGHRNIVFSERGGPIVYINRKLYGASPWNTLYPMASEDGPISPMELWGILAKYGKPVAVISHTGATGMGTDWDKYESIDSRFENIVEIYQGARVSYEGNGAPQPTVGLRRDQSYTADLGTKECTIPLPPNAISDFSRQRSNGLYQHALSRGHKLGVFASSDHISQHASFGGAYVEEDTRTGILRAFQSRITVAATDKIFVEFSCNDHPMGTVFSLTGKPCLNMAVEGTAPLKRVTLVRNEADLKSFDPQGKSFSLQFTDSAPVSGENRYYLRVEQTDGNMAWSSPVWATVSP